MTAINTMMDMWNNAAGAERVLAACVAAACLLCLALRLCLCGWYASRWGAFRLSFRAVESRAEVAALSKGLYAKLARACVVRGDIRADRLDAHDVVEAEAARGRVIGLPARSLEGFIGGIEPVVPTAGFLFAMVNGGSMVIAVATMGCYAALRLLAVPFDHERSREVYVRRAADALEREVCRFYAPRTPMGELAKAGEQLAAVISKSMAAASAQMAETMAAAIGKLDGHTARLEKLTAESGEQIASLRESALHLAARGEGFDENIALIREHQALLERSIQQYEITLKEITAEMGAAFGRIVEYHTGRLEGQL